MESSSTISGTTKDMTADKGEALETFPGGHDTNPIGRSNQVDFFPP